MLSKSAINAACIYSFKVNNRKARTIYGICSKITLKIPEDANDVVLVCHFG